MKPAHRMTFINLRQKRSRGETKKRKLIFPFWDNFTFSTTVNTKNVIPNCRGGKVSSIKEIVHIIRFLFRKNFRIIEAKMALRGGKKTNSVDPDQPTV